MLLELYGGTLMDPVNPKPSDFKLINILMTLHRLPRFGGNTEKMYSVLQHSISCYLEATARGYDWETRKLLFCHDFSEATCGDMPKPLKIQCPEYVKIEDKHQAALYERFEIKGDHDLMHTVDWDMCVYEAQQFMKSKAEHWGKGASQKAHPATISFINNSTPTSCITTFWDICNFLGLTVLDKKD